MTDWDTCGKMIPEPVVFAQDGFIYADYKGGVQKLCRVEDGHVFLWHKGAKEEIKIPIEVIVEAS